MIKISIHLLYILHYLKDEFIITYNLINITESYCVETFFEWENS